MSEIQPCNRGLSAPHPPHPHLSQTWFGGLGFEYDFKKELGSVSLVKREAASGVAWFLDLLKYPELEIQGIETGGVGGGLIRICMVPGYSIMQKARCSAQ